MAKCCGSTCACKLQAGTRTIITGTGSLADPFIINSDVALSVTDNTTFNLTLTGSGSAASPWNLTVDFAATAKLDHLPDVNVPAPTNGQVLAWNSSTSRWEAAAPTTAASGSVNHDTSLAGDGSVGTPLQVQEDPARYLATTGTGLGINDAGINQLVRGFASSAARASASPAPDLNTLSMLDTAPGVMEYWTGAAWAPVYHGFTTQVIGGQMLAISGTYSNQPLTFVMKQVSVTTDASGVFDALSAADLSGRAGVIAAFFQPTGNALSFHANLYADTSKVSGLALRGDNGAAYASQAITGVVYAWVY